MRLRTIACAAALAGSSAVGFAAIPASAAASFPAVTVTCSLSGDTVVSWTHGGHVASLDINWYNSADQAVAQSIVVPKGFQYSAPTPNVGAGGYVQVTANLSSGISGRKPNQPCS